MDSVGSSFAAAQHNEVTKMTEAWDEMADSFEKCKKAFVEYNSTSRELFSSKGERGGLEKTWNVVTSSREFHSATQDLTRSIVNLCLVRFGFEKI